MGQDLKGNHFKLMEDTYENMKDFIIGVFASTNPPSSEPSGKILTNCFLKL